MVYTIFRTDDGMVLRSVVCPENLLDIQSQTGESAIPGDFMPSVYYIHDGEPTIRPESPANISADFVAADGEAAVLLQAVAGTLTVGNETYEVETGEIELTFDTPGDYRIRLDAFPYLPFEAVVHAY